MPIQLDDLLTPLVKPELAQSMYHAWNHLWGEYPKLESLWVILAQVQLETGLKSCHNSNLGNAKSHEGDGYDYQFFGCGEELALGVAEHEAQAHPDLIHIVRQYTSNGTLMASVWVKPEHPWCRFRAFHSLDEGCIDHLSMLNKRFQRAWPAVISGDPGLFAHLLKLQRYYTADESTYTATVKSCFYGWAHAGIDLSSDPLCSQYAEPCLDSGDLTQRT